MVIVLVVLGAGNSRLQAQIGFAAELLQHRGSHAVTNCF
jgi:hypothetical protein